MTGAGVSIPWPEDGVSLLQAEWSRLGMTGWIAVTPTQDGTARLGLTTESSAWMPGFDTLQLAQTLKLDVQHSDDDLLREIWLCLLHSPVLVTYPSAAELLSSVRIRRNISRHAVKTRLNFNTTAVERPEDCWTYSEDTGFILKPGCDLIESLIKASQPPPGGIAYSFSCYRASEYVVLLGLAQEAREVHPALYARLQKQWHTHAVASRRFTLASELDPNPGCFGAGRGRWCPAEAHAHAGIIEPPMRLREALAFSRNMVAARLIEALGPEAVATHAHLQWPLQRCLRAPLVLCDTPRGPMPHVHGPIPADAIRDLVTNGVFRCVVAGALGATGGGPPAAGVVRSPSPLTVQLGRPV